jgi:hypothetical protein
MKSHEPHPSSIDSNAAKTWLYSGLILLLCIYLFQCAEHYFYWLTNPYPNEYREGAGLHAVKLFADGVNPFKEGAPPTFFYMYGFCFPRLTAFFYKISEANGFFTLRLLSFCSLIATSVIVARRAKRMGSAIPSLLIALVVLKTGWVTHELVGRPDQLAMLLLTLCYLLLSGSGRTVSTVSASVLLVLTFYTKQYFFFLGLPLTIGTAFFSLKRALLFGFTTAGLFVLSLICVDLMFPYYFSMTFLSYGSQPFSIQHFSKQTGDFVSNFWPILFLCIFPWIRSTLSTVIGSGTKVSPSTVARLREHEDSLRQLKFWSVQLIGGMLLLTLLGVVPGAWRTYFNQFLLIPMLLVAAALSPSWRETRLFWLSLYAVSFVSLFQVGRSERSKYLTPPLSTTERKSWEEATALVRECGGKIDIRSPLFVKTALENRLEFFQNGLQANEWLAGGYDQLKSRSPKTACLFRNAEPLISAVKLYNEARTAAAASGEGFVVCTDNTSIADEERLVRQGFQHFNEKQLRSGRQVWNVKFWRSDPAPTSSTQAF